LALPSRARARDVIMRTFVPRFVRGDPPNLWKPLAILESAGVGVEVVRPLHYLAAARSEPLMADFVREDLAERRGGGDQEVTIEDVLAFIARRPSAIFDESRWSATVQVKVARGLLAALRDFGMLEGGSRKRLAPAYLPVGAFSLVAFVFGMRERSGDRLLHHPDWRLFMFAGGLVERMFVEAHQHRLLEFQAAGRVVRVDFPADQLEDYAHVVAARAH